MYRLLRSMLAITIWLGAYLGVLAIFWVPQIGLIFAAVLIFKQCRKVFRHTAHGTARWATPDDIPHLLDGDGLILGHMEGRVSRLGGIKAVFDRRIPAPRSGVPCQQILRI